MADRIKLLPEPVANQIAAGEVVNRPSSVVKELLENAVDAGSETITVNFRDGGKTLIQVIDDGAGMSPNDARLAFDRHATSKINTVEDIYGLETFGFRGEALASIASVAEVELRTRQHDEELGTLVEISGGKFVSQSRVNCPAGSQFSVRNIFYNVPARRRFLEKSSAETRNIVAEYQRVALCNPHIAFNLYDNDVSVSRLPASGLRQRIIGITGKSMVKSLLEVKADTSIIKIEGFTGHPSSARQNNKMQFLFVNGRYFKSPYFHKAVLSAYEKLIPQNTQPAYFIYLTIDPEKIDVNVHPQKTEVKFENGADTWHIINAAVRETLAKSGAVPGMDFDTEKAVEIPVFRESVVYKVPRITANPEFNPFAEPPAAEGGRRGLYDISDLTGGFGDGRGTYRTHAGDGVGNEVPYEESVLEYIEGDGTSQTRLKMECGDSKEYRIMQAGIKYAVAVNESNLTVIDLGRAYESVLYDKYFSMLENGSSASQQLLFPESVTMSTDDFDFLKECKGEIAAFGFDIEQGGENRVEITGIPADFTSVPAEQLLYELLDLLREGVTMPEQVKRHRLAAFMARTGSSSKTKKMSSEELESLLDMLNRCDNPSFTPGGKQVIFTITPEEIGKRLGN